MRFGAASPLGIYSACHARTLEQCAQLRSLASNMDHPGFHVHNQDIARGLLAHFDVVQIRNHADEEQCLFTALLDSMSAADPVCLREMTCDLTGEHRSLERMWSMLRERVEGASRGIPTRFDEDEVRAFVAAWVRHIEFEETQLLPMASRLIDGCELVRLRSIMRAKDCDIHSLSGCA